MPRRTFLPLVVALALAGCGDDDESASTEPPISTPSATTETAPPDPADLDREPRVAKPSGPPPRRLVKEDIVVGKGRPARPGNELTVRYVGVSYSTGEQFDASWDRGEDFPFQLGAGMVIPGWDQGLEGMRAGGRRKLIVPPDLAYGAQGSPPVIGPNETLVFVIDLKRVG